jgi:protein SCO1/2
MSFSRLRRQCLRGLGALALGHVIPAAQAGTAVVGGIPEGHGYFYPPVPLPDFSVTDQHGKTANLQSLLADRLSALQVIFTGCTNVCPMQGATFRQLQDLLAAAGQTSCQLLSLSLDPLSDSPQALRDWLQRFDPAPGWLALRPDLKASDLVRNTFNRGLSELNAHLTEVYLIDRRGRLVWRSPELPSAESLADKLLAMRR